MKKKDLVRKDRIIEYLDNIERQIEDIKSIPVSSKDFFLDQKNTIQNLYSYCFCAFSLESKRK